MGFKLKGFKPGNGSTLKMKKGSAYKIMTKGAADAARTVQSSGSADAGRGGTGLKPRATLNKMAERASGTGMKTRGKRAERATREASVQRAARAKSKMEGVGKAMSPTKLVKRVSSTAPTMRGRGKGGTKRATPSKAVRPTKDARQAIGGVRMGGKSFGERMVNPAPTKLIRKAIKGTGKLGGAVLRNAKSAAGSGTGIGRTAAKSAGLSRASTKAGRMIGSAGAAGGSPQKFVGGALVRVGSKLLPRVIGSGGKVVAKKGAKNVAKAVTYVPEAAAKTTGQKIVSGLKSGAKYMVGGYAFDKALGLMFPGKKAKDLTEKQKSGVAAAAAKGAKFAADKAKKGSQANAYNKAAKRDPKLAKFVAERNKHPKGSEAYNAAQNRINRAYGVKKRHGVTKTTATKGRTTVTRGRTPGIGERAKMTKDRAIGGRKQVDHAKSYITGKSKERKTKKDAGKVKERFYDAQGNLEKKVKMKGDGKNLRKVKITKKTADTVTKTKINKRTGRKVTKTRKRRMVGLGDKLAGLVGR